MVGLPSFMTWSAMTAVIGPAQLSNAALIRSLSSVLSEPSPERDQTEKERRTT